MKYNFVWWWYNYILNNWWWNTTLLNYDRAIYQTIDDEIQLCLIIIVVYIKQ